MERLREECAWFFVARVLDGGVTTMSKPIPPVSKYMSTGPFSIGRDQTLQRAHETVRAVGLLGAKVVVSGVSPQIAMTLTNLGIALDGVETVGTLADGLRLALALLGVELRSPA